MAFLLVSLDSTGWGGDKSNILTARRIDRYTYVQNELYCNWFASAALASYVAEKAAESANCTPPHTVATGRFYLDLGQGSCSLWYFLPNWPSATSTILLGRHLMLKSVSGRALAGVRPHGWQ